MATIPEGSALPDDPHVRGSPPLVFGLAKPPTLEPTVSPRSADFGLGGATPRPVPDDSSAGSPQESLTDLRMGVGFSPLLSPSGRKASINGYGGSSMPSLMVQENLEQQKHRLEALTCEMNSLLACVSTNIASTCALLAHSSTTAVEAKSGGEVPLHGLSLSATSPVHNSAGTVGFVNPNVGREDDPELNSDGVSEKEKDTEMVMDRGLSHHRFMDNNVITQDLLPPERQKLVLRLQARIGLRDGEGIVFASRIERCLQNLGSERYTHQEVEELLVAIGQSFPEGFVDAGFDMPAAGNSSMASSRSGFALTRSASQQRNSGNKRRLSRQNHKLFDLGMIGIRFRVFVKALLDNDLSLRYSPEIAERMMTIREVLISGDANRLVARLTQVHVDDLAAPEQKVDLVLRMEPFVALVVVVNGLLIGLETDMGTADPDATSFWMWADVPFSLFFFVEMMLKLCRSGIVTHFWHHEDCGWNWFDAFVVLFGVLDIMAVIFISEMDVNPQSFTVVRIVRLMKLSRLLRFFNMKHMRELSLMVKGLVAGMRTLFWAIVLLFFTVYIIAVVTTQSLGQMHEVSLAKDDELFATVPGSMLTVFRCFIGDCEDSTGAPIVKALSDAYGWRFVLPYVAATVFVTFGLFNLIFAIYIETTLSAAKLNRRMSKAEHLRVARLTKELLKKFCHAHNISADLAKDNNHKDNRGTRRLMKQASKLGELEDYNMTVSKDLFLLVLQDQEVQQLMDALDIPPDREQLFDIIDADSSGDLQASELIRGLLSVRGEARKSDVVAALLAVRACQTMLRDMYDFQHDWCMRLSAVANGNAPPQHQLQQQFSSGEWKDSALKRTGASGKLQYQRTDSRLQNRMGGFRREPSVSKEGFLVMRSLSKQ